MIPNIQDPMTYMCSNHNLKPLIRPCNLRTYQQVACKGRPGPFAAREAGSLQDPKGLDLHAAALLLAVLPVDTPVVAVLLAVLAVWLYLLLAVLGADAPVAVATFAVELAGAGDTPAVPDRAIDPQPEPAPPVPLVPPPHHQILKHVLQ